MTSHWAEGIEPWERREFAPSLNIKGDDVASIEFVEEPVKIKGDRLTVKVKFLSGIASATSPQGIDKAKAGQEYTLWLRAKSLQLGLVNLFGKNPSLKGKRVTLRRDRWRGYSIYQVTEYAEGAPPSPSADPKFVMLWNNLKEVLNFMVAMRYSEVKDYFHDAMRIDLSEEELSNFISFLEKEEKATNFKEEKKIVKKEK